MTHHDEPTASDSSPLIHWRRLPFSDEPLGRQFALSESMLATLRDVSVPAFRWYAPRETALALGNGQPLTSVDMVACQARGIAVYRRSSGGTAVLVDEAAFSLDLALPTAHPLATSDVTLAYRWVGEMMAQAMCALGASGARAIPTAEVRALPALAPDDPLRLACYGALSPWEVVVPPTPGPSPAAAGEGRVWGDVGGVDVMAGRVSNTPRKLVGLCQVRRLGGALFQIGFYRRFDAQALAALLAIPDDARQPLAARLADATAGLRGEASRRRPHKGYQIMRAVEHALAHYVGGEIEDSEWTQAELATADRLERDRFERLE
ncbi:MAG TPA: hypothetical protein VMV29_08135 [Ktedonobacterales bacterium]|nr:hypothetical protein [Ktedonobacterales bacterium]